MVNERTSLALPKFAELVQKALSKDRAFIFVFVFVGRAEWVSWGSGFVRSMQLRFSKSTYDL